MRNISASRYSPMIREKRSVSASASVSVSARIGLPAPDCAGVTSQNT
jgi:hypothetical protein